MITQFYGLHIDFWHFILQHLACLLHILFLSCYLRLTQPIILTIWSASVSDIFFNNTLVSVWSLLSEQDQNTFMQGHSGNFLDQFLSAAGHTETLPDVPGHEHLQHQGNIYVVCYGPGLCDFALAVVMRDPGNIKYEPRLAVLRAQLHFLC